MQAILGGEQMSLEEREEQIVQQIAACQDQLFAYILTLVPHRDVARDILQETNLVLWRRREEFVPGTSFVAWASKTKSPTIRLSRCLRSFDGTRPVCRRRIWCCPGRASCGWVHPGHQEMAGQTESP